MVTELNWHPATFRPQRNGMRIAVTDGEYIAQMIWDDSYDMLSIRIGMNIWKYRDDEEYDEKESIGKVITHWFPICGYGTLVSHIAQNKIVAKHYYTNEQAKVCKKCNHVWNAKMYKRCSHCYGEGKKKIKNGKGSNLR